MGQEAGGEGGLLFLAKIYPRIVGATCMISVHSFLIGDMSTDMSTVRVVIVRKTWFRSFYRSRIRSTMPRLPDLVPDLFCDAADLVAASSTKSRRVELVTNLLLRVHAY